MSEQEYAKIIARNLRNIMFETGKTQSEVCKDLDIRKQTMSTWMNGVRIPRMDKIDMLCRYFGVSRSDLMEPHNEEYYLRRDTARVAQEIFDNQDMRILFDAARSSRPEDLRMAADLLKRLKQTNPDG